MLSSNFEAISIDTRSVLCYCHIAFEKMRKNTKIFFFRMLGLFLRLCVCFEVRLISATNVLFLIVVLVFRLFEVAGAATHDYCLWVIMRRLICLVPFFYKK